MRRLIATLAIAAALAAIAATGSGKTTGGFVASSAVAHAGGSGTSESDGVGLCGPYFNNTGVPGLQYRQQVFDDPAGQSPTPTSLTANITLKNDLMSGNSGDLVASWDLLGTSTSNPNYWIQAGVMQGDNLNSGVPFIYVETHGGSYNGSNVDGHHIFANAQLGTTYTMSVYAASSTQYYATVKAGTTTYRYPSSGYVTYTAPLNDAQVGNEEMDVGDACQYDDSAYANVTLNNNQTWVLANGSCAYGELCFTNLPPTPYESQTQTNMLLKSWYTHGFESWGNNCYVQGKCMAPAP
ncbi:MAG TPA: hypothetical protein VE985_02085 [Gaiellaceae bacterium]|nr:hypothetical protein [Gaiellaceae bacterium]